MSGSGSRQARSQGQGSPETSYSGFSPNIPLTLPRWGGPPPPPLPHHPHSHPHQSTSAWAGSSLSSNARARPGSSSEVGGGSISLAKITQPPPGTGTGTSTTSDFYRRDSDDHSASGSGSGSGIRIGQTRIDGYDPYAQRPSGSGTKFERDVSESPSIGVGGNHNHNLNDSTAKKRRRDSEKPVLEEMDDRYVSLSCRANATRLIGRPLAITCAPCRSRKISRSTVGALGETDTCRVR